MLPSAELKRWRLRSQPQPMVPARQTDTAAPLNSPDKLSRVIFPSIPARNLIPAAAPDRIFRLSPPMRLDTSLVSITQRSSGPSCFPSHRTCSPPFVMTTCLALLRPTLRIRLMWRPAAFPERSQQDDQRSLPRTHAPHPTP